MKGVISSFLIVVFFFGSFYLFFLRSPHYKIGTIYNKGLFLIKNLTKTNSTSSQSNSGFCAPQGCGYPNNLERENIYLELSGEQLTSLVNQYKSSEIPLSGIKISIKDNIIYASANSVYKVVPGNISASAKLDLNHFYVQDVYIGSIKAPEKISNFIEANFDKLLKDSLLNIGINVNKMELINNKIFINAIAPKGMVTIGQDGIIQVDLSKKPTNKLPQEDKDIQY